MMFTSYNYNRLSDCFDTRFDSHNGRYGTSDMSPKVSGASTR